MPPEAPMRMVTRPLAALIARGLLACGLLSSPAWAAVLDPNFTETTWIDTNQGNGVTGMAWAPDGSGRLFLTYQWGPIRIVKSGPPVTLVPTPFATVSPIFDVGECGLLGIAFDPDFVDNGYVYVFATVSTVEQQVIRYRAVGDIGTDKTVVVPGLPTRGANHDGGAVGFGRDGKLYWAIGDQGNRTGADADLTSLSSKVGRANADGTVPSDNPFVDGPGGNNDYIFARGFRNPFTFTFQPETGKLWVDDVGDGYEQVFAVSAGEHAGWDDYENTQPAGFIPPLITYATNGTAIRNIPATAGAARSGNVATFSTTAVHGFRQGERIAIAGVADPTFNGDFYIASVPSSTSFAVPQAGPDAVSGGGTAETQNQGGAITGGTFYDATGAPPSYQGNFFYGDYNSGRVMRATVGPGTTVTSVDYWATGNTHSIDVAVGPDGALYYVGRAGTILRAAPVATAQAIVVSNRHVWMGEGRSAVFTVRLAQAPASNVTVQVARTGGSPEISVSNGATRTFTPGDFAIPQAVRLSSMDDADLVPDSATLTLSSSGLASQTVEASSTDTSGAVGGTGPGRVPSLIVRKNAENPSDLDLLWSESCGGTATGYSVHEGVLGSWYSHDAILCSTSGATEATISPGSSGRYYLVVSLDAHREGSYGTDSLGIERPRSSTRCRLERDVTPCP